MDVCVSYFILLNTNYERQKNVELIGKIVLIQEDHMIEELVKKYGQKSWANIALHISKLYGIPRTGKQCRERYTCFHVDGTITWIPTLKKKFGAKKKNNDFFSCMEFTATSGLLLLNLFLAGTVFFIQNRQLHKELFLFNNSPQSQAGWEVFRFKKQHWTNERH